MRAVLQNPLGNITLAGTLVGTILGCTGLLQIREKREHLEENPTSDIFSPDVGNPQDANQDMKDSVVVDDISAADAEPQPDMEKEEEPLQDLGCKDLIDITTDEVTASIRWSTNINISGEEGGRGYPLSNTLLTSIRTAEGEVISPWKYTGEFLFSWGIETGICPERSSTIRILFMDGTREKKAASSRSRGCGGPFVFSVRESSGLLTKNVKVIRFSGYRGTIDGKPTKEQADYLRRAFRCHMLKDTKKGQEAPVSQKKKSKRGR